MTFISASALPARLILLFLAMTGPVILHPAPLRAQGNGSVVIRFSTDSRMFPKKWYGKKINAQAEALDTAVAGRVSRVIQATLSKYPASLQSRYLERIYVFRSLRFYGFPYGGTYSRKTIYLTFDPANPNYTDESLEAGLHHEFSSILWKENMNRLRPKEWMELNPPGFTYGEGGANAIRSGVAAMRYEPGLFMIGFLNDYSVADLEQDINVFAQNLFSGGADFWKIADDNPAVLAKARLLIRFFASLDPRFTESYFRQLR